MWKTYKEAIFMAKANKDASKEAGTIKITLIRSKIGTNPKQRATLVAMGLKKINQTVEMPNNEAVRGMINRVVHLVRIEQ